MPNSDIKSVVRTLYREKAYALINLCGLSLAIACCLILGLYLRSELTYDQHHTRHKEIYRVVNEFTTGGSSPTFAVTSVALGPLLKQAYPAEVKDYVRLRRASDCILRDQRMAVRFRIPRGNQPDGLLCVGCSCNRGGICRRLRCNPTGQPRGTSRFH